MGILNVLKTAWSDDDDDDVIEIIKEMIDDEPMKFVQVNDGELDSNTATVSIIINTVNDNFPTDIILSNNFIDENLSGVTIGQFTAEDLDLPADIHTLELVSGAGDSAIFIYSNKSYR